MAPQICSLCSTPVGYRYFSHEVCGAGDDAGSRDETWRILSIHHDDNELQISRTCSAAATAGLIYEGKAVTGHAMVIMSQETLGSTWRQPGGWRRVDHVPEIAKDNAKSDAGDGEGCWHSEQWTELYPDMLRKKRPRRLSKCLSGNCRRAGADKHLHHQTTPEVTEPGCATQLAAMAPFAASRPASKKAWQRLLDR
ncbi:hypothetical protein CI102_11477 [Trichoderma harzianum]|nr:hypothetical protein CI102_11477 [Trichoderma harzianum]